MITKLSNDHFRSFCQIQQTNFRGCNFPGKHKKHLYINLSKSKGKVKEGLRILKPNKSPGYDNISSNVVNVTSDIFFIPLKYIFNLSLQQRIFPENSKIAKVPQIYKKDEEFLQTNYRPISDLPCFSKLLERITYNWLFKCISENSILYEKQFGFQTSHSIEHAMLLLVNQLYQSFDENKFTLGIFIDLSKTFDTVDHKILTKRLELYGIKGCNLRCFESYLSNRKQFITYGDKQTNLHVEFLKAQF